MITITTAPTVNSKLKLIFTARLSVSCRLMYLKRRTAILIEGRVYVT